MVKIQNQLNLLLEICTVHNSRNQNLGKKLSHLKVQIKISIMKYFYHYKNITRENFNDLVRALNFTKSKVEILGSRLKQWNLHVEVNITDQRSRHEIFFIFFTNENGLWYCNDVKGLLKKIGITRVSSDWRLFIYSSPKVWTESNFHVDHSV